MKAKAVVASVIVATVVAVVLIMTVFPGQQPAPDHQPAAATPPQPVPEVTPAEPQPPAAKAAPAAARSPLPTEEELAAIEARIRNSVHPRPVRDRIADWWSHARAKSLPEGDMESARALYMGFLDNFTQIKTARFRVETFKTLEDGSGRLCKIEDIVWTPEKRRDTVTRLEDPDKPATITFITDGESSVAWRDGRLVEDRKATHPGIPTEIERYLFRDYGNAVLERRPGHLMFNPQCDIDDGTVGYSRVWNEFGDEVLFDAATGLLTEDRYSFEQYSGGRRYAYQKTDGLWFLSEIAVIAQGRTIERKVLSNVVLNKPIDEGLFDVGKPD